MERCFYHGCEFYWGLGNGSDSSYVDTFSDWVFKIIDSGKIMIYSDLERYKGCKEKGHICLGRYDDSIDYNTIDFPKHMSCFDAWNGMGCISFIVSSQIPASRYPDKGVFDEWRTDEEILLDKIVGMAIPLDSIQSYIDSSLCSLEEKRLLTQNLAKTMEICKEKKWLIVNSDEPNFYLTVEKKLEAQDLETSKKL